MAKQFVEVLTSDFSGAQSDEVDTVQFALDGRAYEIELTLTSTRSCRRR